MAEVHTNISSGANNTQIIFHNPAQHPLPSGAGQPAVAAVKSAGQPNGSVSGQIANTSVVVRNPA